MADLWIWVTGSGGGGELATALAAIASATAVIIVATKKRRDVDIREMADRITALEEDSDEKDTEIKGLRAEVATLRQELVLRDHESFVYRRTLAMNGIPDPFLERRRHDDHSTGQA